jgi:hypothetical protein
MCRLQHFISDLWKQGGATPAVQTYEVMIAIVRFAVALASSDMPLTRRTSRKGAQERRGGLVDGRRTPECWPQWRSNSGSGKLEVIASGDTVPRYR